MLSIHKKITITSVDLEVCRKIILLETITLKQAVHTAYCDVYNLSGMPDISRKL